ncbi:MAG: L,D-transpeptidase family protein [Myxococcales bacterium]|nr:L,D-transpeptidase family protein [Myxococcales bacterium]
MLEQGWNPVLSKRIITTLLLAAWLTSVAACSSTNTQRVGDESGAMKPAPRPKVTEGPKRKIAPPTILAQSTVRQRALDLILTWQRQQLERRLDESQLNTHLQGESNAAARSFVRRLYRKLDWSPLFTASGTPSAGALALIELVSRIDEHGLRPSRFQRDELLKAKEELARFKRELDEVKALSWPQTTIRGREVVDELAFFERLRHAHPALHRRMLQLKVNIADLSKRLPGWEIAFARSFFHVADSFRYSHRRGNPEKLIAAIVGKRERIATWIARWVPNNPVYRELMKQLARFRAIARNSETFERISLTTRHHRRVLRHRKIDLRARKKYSVLAAIYPRFIAWGYLPKETPKSIVFDPTWRSALWRFQAEHGLPQRSRLDSHTIQALNMSTTQRLKRILLALEKWRSSRLAGQRYFVRVNVPSFLLEVHADGAIIARHRVVVGSNKKEYSPIKKQIGNFNRTAELSSRIVELIVNPIWRVPPRIKKLEIDKELEKDPEYLEKHNYKVITLSNGLELVQQQPGPGNALGRVKFQFPNRHGIYIHDTPSKSLFKKEYRAFSHGCIRVRNPLKLAELLLTRDGNISMDRLRSIIRSLKETPVRMRRPVPIAIEYHTAGLGEDGTFQFFRDVYEQDQPLLSRVPLEGY